MDKRIGTYNPDETRTLPELTISGNPVRPPIAGDIRLDAIHFIVLDALPTVDVVAELETLKDGLPGAVNMGSFPPASVTGATQPSNEQTFPTGATFTAHATPPSDSTPNVDELPPTDTPRRRG